MLEVCPKCKEKALTVAAESRDFWWMCEACGVDIEEEDFKKITTNNSIAKCFSELLKG